MKHRRSILRTVVIRFIGYYFGIELVISTLEDIFGRIIKGADKVFLLDRFPGMAADIKTEQIIMAVVWGLVQLLVYCGGNRTIRPQYKPKGFLSGRTHDRRL